VVDIERLTQGEKFKSLKIGEVIDIDVSLLQPSQPNDYRTPLSKGPIDVCYEGGRILIVDGNHRYWEAVDNTCDGDDRLISVRKVDSPYEI